MTSPDTNPPIHHKYQIISSLYIKTYHSHISQFTQGRHPLCNALFLVQVHAYPDQLQIELQQVINMNQLQGHCYTSYLPSNKIA